MTENLWFKSIREYWRDPANVIGPPGALVRRVIKALWLVLSIYVLFWIAGPSQVSSWRLWMQDDRLAHDLAWGFTFASALCFAVVGYAAEGTKPIRMPIPFFEFEGSLRNVKIHTTHLHLPNVRVALGSLFAISLFFMSLVGMWNYYLHENITTGGSSVAAIEGTTSRVAEAEAELRAHDERTAASLATIDQAIAQTSAGSPTGRSRLVAQRTAAAAAAATERRALQAELRAARGETVEVRETAADPRPVDGVFAAALGADRSLVSTLLDLMRSGVVEALLILGAGLGLAGSVSRIGVPKHEESFAPAPSVEDVVAPTEPAPSAPAEPPPRRRNVLPAATEQDLAEAVVVGPHAVQPAPEPEPKAVQEPEEPTVAEEEIDPLVAEQLVEEAA